MPEPEFLQGRRVVSVPAALDTAVWPADSIVLRVAPDEAFVVGDGDLVVDDPHALIEDDASLAAITLPLAEAGDLLVRLCDWEWPIAGEFLSQGLVAGVPVRVWTRSDRVLLIVPSSYLHEVEERLG